jgi:hypothetical protein
MRSQGLTGSAREKQKLGKEDAMWVSGQAAQKWVPAAPGVALLPVEKAGLLLPEEESAMVSLARVI